MEDSLFHHLHYFKTYLRPHQKVLILSFLLSAVSTVLGLSQPYFAKVLIDKVFLGNGSRLLFPLLLILILLFVVSFAVRMGNSTLYTAYSAKLLFTMREDLFDRLQRAPLNFFVKTKIGDIFSRIASDIADVQGLLTETIPHFLLNLITCAVTVLILLWLNWKMAVMSLCFLPAALYMMHHIRPRLSALATSVAESNADISHLLLESLSNTSVIRAFGAEKLVGEKLRERQSSLLRFLMQHQTLKVFSGSVSTIIIIINTVVVFGYGGFLVLGGALSIGSLVAFSIYQGRAFAPLQGLMDGWLAFQKSKVALRRVREILNLDPLLVESGGLVPGERILKGEVVFEQVSFAYEPGEPVFTNLSLRIPSRQMSAIVGPSGVGKSTLCHLILRLFDPHKGSITLDGIGIKQFDTPWLRRQIALVPQDPLLFHTTIRENIAFSRPRAGDTEVIEAAKAAHIHDFIQTLPRGYETVVGDRGFRLSGGEKQRISIARAILAEPQILIFDEATAFLDAETEERVIDAMRVLMHGRTMLVVSHRLSAIKHAALVVALKRGEVVSLGSYEDFARTDGRILPDLVAEVR